MEILLARQQAELAALQQRVEASRSAAARLIAEFTHGQSSHPDESVQYLRGVDSIRDYLAALNNQVEEEFLTFAPGGAQTEANMRASRRSTSGYWNVESICARYTWTAFDATKPVLNTRNG
ncbi:hypothetical protein R1T08_03015 [Streptomyces sp. SBC-4]|nr:hypothetical protein [Streptomyces sp. SBC-4]MDV5143305.1 hypothetical protein [Streptomyces sp. SBC-4]